MNKSNLIVLSLAIVKNDTAKTISLLMKMYPEEYRSLFLNKDECPFDENMLLKIAYSEEFEAYYRVKALKFLKTSCCCIRVIENSEDDDLISEIIKECNFIDDQKLFEKLSREGGIKTRIAATQKINSQKDLMLVAENDVSEAVRKEALKKVCDSNFLYCRFKNAITQEERLIAFSAITEEEYLIKILEEDEKYNNLNMKMFSDACEKIQNIEFLRKYIEKNSDTAAFSLFANLAQKRLSILT